MVQLNNLALVGCGAAASRYYVPALKKVLGKSKNTVFLVDSNITQAEKIRDELGGGLIAESVSEIIGRVRGAIVVLPHFLHFPIGMELLTAGIHVLCEKPVAERAEEVAAMKTAAMNSGATLCVNNTRRMFPSLQMVKRILDNKELGSLKSILYTEGSTFAWPSANSFYVDPRVSSKGVLFDIGSHALDTLCWWLGSKPEVVSFEDDSFGGPESVARIKLKFGDCAVQVLLNRLNDLDNGFDVVGDAGSIKGKLFEWDRITVCSKNDSARVQIAKDSAKTYPEFVVPIVDNFLRVIEGNAKPLIPAAEVANSIALIEECYRKRTRMVFPENASIPHVLKKHGRRVLITGATGFIGGRVAEILHLSQERDVKVGVRKWSSAARIGRIPFDITELDLLNKEQIEHALQGVSEVIHCAKGPDGATADGTRNLLEASTRMGIKRIVHLSTTEVYGHVSGIIDETMPFQYTGNEYNRTKIDAEKICWEYIQKGMPIAIIRPSIVYGPYSQNWSVRFAKMFINGKWGIFEGSGHGKCNLVYVDDLVNAILICLEHEGATGQAFNICGPDVPTWNEYFIKFNDMLGLPPLRRISAAEGALRVRLMQPVRFAGGLVRDHFMGSVKKIAETFTVAKKLMQQTEDALKITPAPDEFVLFRKDACFAAEKATRVLGIRPLISMHKGIEITVKWLVQQGFQS